MENKIFLVESNGYSSSLLSFYLERNVNCQTFNFFSWDEALNYLKMSPKLIVLSQSGDEQIELLGEKIVESGNHNMKILNIQGGYIELLGINPTTKKTQIEESMIASNIYMSIMDIFKGVLKNIKITN